MTLKKFAVTFALGSVALLTAGATSMTAQSHINPPDPLLGTPSVSQRRRVMLTVSPGTRKAAECSTSVSVSAAMGPMATARA